MRIQEQQVRYQAEQAVEFVQNGARKRGGWQLRRKANPYGVALKYIFALRDLTFEEASQLGGFTAQNINYIVNRMKKNRFDTIYIDKICHTFNIERQYFIDLVNEISLVMEGK